MQGTVATFDDQAGSGTVVTDTGVAIAFPTTAFVRSGLRLLRPGQRVTLLLGASGEVELVTIPGFPGTEAAPRG